MQIERKRSASKTISWLICAAMSTFTISLFATSGFTAWEVIAFDLAWRSAVFYGHERAWSFVGFGIKPSRVLLCSSSEGDGYTSRHL